MVRVTVKFIILLVLLTLGILSGCGSNQPNVTRYPITVDVSLDGKPFDGTISFTPRDAKTGNYGTGGKLTAGKFSADQKFGPTAGNFDVIITVYDPTAKTPTSNTDSEEGPQPVIKGYAKKVIELKEGTKDFKFDITSSELTDQPNSQD